MPTFDVSQWSPRQPWAAGYHALSTMLSPTQEAARQELFTVMRQTLLVQHLPDLDVLGLPPLSLDGTRALLDES